MHGSGLRILIVEDHLLIAKQLEVIASGAGHVVTATVRTGEEACEIALRRSPDLVFLDVSLVGAMSGVDVARFIADHCTASVLFTTANRRRLPEDFCGAIGVVEKPFTRAGFLSSITYVTTRLQRPQSRSAAPDSLLLGPIYATLWHPHQAQDVSLQQSQRRQGL